MNAADKKIRFRFSAKVQLTFDTIFDKTNQI